MKEAGARRGEPLYNWGGASASLHYSGAPEEQPIKEEQNHGANNRHRPAGDIILAHEKAAEICPDEGTGDTEQNCDDASTRIFAGHQELSESADDKPDDQNSNDGMTAKVHREMNVKR